MAKEPENSVLSIQLDDDDNEWSEKNRKWSENDFDFYKKYSSTNILGWFLCFNGISIFVEEQQWHYLTHSWMDKEVYTFP